MPAAIDAKGFTARSDRPSILHGIQALIFALLFTLAYGTLFISLFERFKKLGYESFNLGLVVLSGVGEISPSSRLERGMHYLYEHLNQFYNFQGLRAYKNKFNPRWESRYLVYPRLATLPDVVVGLVRADSGDRLGDYLGTQFLSTAVTSLFKRLN